MFKKSFAVAGVLSCVLTANTASAALLVSYPFTTNTAASSVAAGVSSTFESAQLDRYRIGSDGFGNVFQAYRKPNAISAATALSLDTYFSINVAADPGKSLYLSSLSFEVGKGGSSDPRGYRVRSSVDGYASDLALVTLTSGAATAPAPVSIDLSTLGSFEGLSSVDFRIYVWAPTNSNSVDFRNLEVNGTLPTPRTLGLVLAAMGGLVGMRVRQRQLAAVSSADRYCAISC